MVETGFVEVGDCPKFSGKNSLEQWCVGVWVVVSLPGFQVFVGNRCVVPESYKEVVVVKGLFVGFLKLFIR